MNGVIRWVHTSWYGIVCIWMDGEWGIVRVGVAGCIWMIYVYTYVCVRAYIVYICICILVYICVSWNVTKGQVKIWYIMMRPNCNAIIWKKVYQVYIWIWPTPLAYRYLKKCWVCRLFLKTVFGGWNQSQVIEYVTKSPKTYIRVNNICIYIYIYIYIQMFALRFSPTTLCPSPSRFFVLPRGFVIEWGGRLKCITSRTILCCFSY